MPILTMLSVIIIAKNEEANIKTCLESVKWANEIILLDSGSDDKTVEIARAYTKNVFQTDWQGYGVQKQRALSYATQDWVLNLDADEFVDEALKSDILSSIQKNEADAFRIPIQMCFYGKSMRYSGSPSRHIRLFKRKNAQYSLDIVHEKIILPPKAVIGKIIHPIQHHSFQDLSHALYKMNKYSSYTAKIRICNKESASLAKTLMSSFWMFFRCYVLQKGFLDGKEGLVLAILSAQGTLSRGLKQLYPDKALQSLPPVKDNASCMPP